MAKIPILVVSQIYGYIKSIAGHLDPEITVLSHFSQYLISYANRGEWFFKNYHQIENFFQLVEKIARKSLF